MQRSGTTLCCVPASIWVTVSFVPSQPLRDEGELESPQSFDSLGGFVEGVDSLFAGSVSRPPVRGTVEHQQPLFADGRLHGRRFAHDGQIDRGAAPARPGRCRSLPKPPLRPKPGKSGCRVARCRPGTGRRRAAIPDWLRRRCCPDRRGDLPSSAGSKGVAAPAGHRFHGVDVRVEQEGRFRRVVLPGQGPYVVADAVRGESVFFRAFRTGVGLPVPPPG